MVHNRYNHFFAVTMSYSFIIHTLQILPALLIGLTVHEFAHAYVAYLCWDNTAKRHGRLSLNPIKHIDPAGFLLIILIWFWWAKPVTFDRSKLKNPEMDEIKIALAWPFSNALLAMIFSGILLLLSQSISTGGFMNSSFFEGMIYYGIFINWGLFVFNLIPIPPLDGSHLLNGSFGGYAWYQWLQQYGIGILILILLIQSFSSITILPIQNITSWVGMWFLELIGGGTTNL